MRTAARRAIVVTSAIVACAFGACVTANFEDGKYACTPGAAAVCPDGLLCARDGRCRVRELPVFEDGGDPDTGPNDAGTDTGDCTSARWRAIFDARAPEAVEVRNDGRVFAVGGAGTAGWIAELDRCTGAVLKERTLTADQQTETLFHAIASQGDDLVVAGGSKGGDAGQVYHGKFALDLTPAAPTDRTKLPIGDATRISIGADGTNWLSGTQPGGGFVARVASTICSATFATAPGGLVARDTGAADVLRDGNPAPLAFVDSACAVSAAPQTLVVGNGNVDVTSMVAARGGLVAIGTALGAGANTLFWVGETKVGESTWSLATLDPNSQDRDVGRRIVFDGTSLFAAVSQRASANSGTPTLYRYDGAIFPPSKPFWAATPFGPILLEVRDVAVGAGTSDAIYVAAVANQGGGIARCTKAGDCQP